MIIARPRSKSFAIALANPAIPPPSRLWATESMKAPCKERGPGVNLGPFSFFILVKSPVVRRELVCTLTGPVSVISCAQSNQEVHHAKHPFHDSGSRRFLDRVSFAQGRRPGGC